MKSLLIVLVLLLGCNSTPSASSFDHSAFDKLLKHNVNKKGLVNYEGFKNNDSFKKYLKQIGEASVDKFSESEKLAFYINTYNALIIKNVLDHPNIKSPMEVDGFFKKIKFEVAGEHITLDELEHNYTLKIDGVLPHFGLVCGAKSCPKLIAKSYSSKDVFKQLKKNAKEFLGDKSRNYYDKENDTLHLSAIFNWFKGYFETKYGTLTKAVKLLSSKKIGLDISSSTKVKFLKYNWKLNAQ